MQNTILGLQVILAAGLLNVWLIRFKQQTPFRGGNARNMGEEFLAYGLPKWATYVVGLLKVGAALALIGGIWVPELILPAASLVTALMIGAILMHAKIRDPFMKSVPAGLMFAISASLVYSVTCVV